MMMMARIIDWQRVILQKMTKKTKKMTMMKTKTKKIMMMNKTKMMMKKMMKIVK